MKLFTRLLLCLTLIGIFPLSEAGYVRAEAAEQSKKKKSSKSKKKKSSKKKKPTAKQKKQASSYYKRGLSKAKKKDYAGALEDLKKSYKLVPSKKTKSQIQKITALVKKQGSAAAEAEAVEIKSPPIVKKGPRVNTAAYADELFNLTGELKSSNRELARATRYLYDEKPKQQNVSLQPKPFYTTADYEKESRLNPENLYLQRQLGMHYEGIGDWSAAKDIYLREIAKNPQKPDVHFYLGSLYANMGEYANAKFAFEEALALDPNHRATIEAMSLFTRTDDQRELSQEILTLSSERVPDGPAQRLNLIQQDLASGDLDNALRMAEEGNRKFPDHVGFVQLTGETYLKMGQIEESKQAFQRAIKLNPKEILPHLSLASVYFDQGKYVYAALSFSNAVYLDPDNPDHRYMQGLSYFNATEWGRAAAAWEDMLHYNPNNAIVRNLLPQTYYVMAVEYNRIGNPTLGRQSFKNALSVNNNSAAWLPGAMATLGKYYREKRMFRESLVAYQEVLELSPNDATAYMGIGVTYWKMDEKQLARASWERSLQIQPDNNDSRGWLILSAQDS
ncbi:MAG: tetratricopeptide repeat protein [Candidatus Neomarinimicrobiota bacterium]|nr:tetratricopeptide repeat protein [Candidatus Neomarinimicrobiota bacterium]